MLQGCSWGIRAGLSSGDLPQRLLVALRYYNEEVIMTISIEGRDFPDHEVQIINGRMTLVVPGHSTAAVVVNGVEYTEYYYHVADGVATLSVPMGEALAPPSEQLTLAPIFDTLDSVVEGLDRLIGGIDERIGERSLAPVIAIEAARGGSKHSHRARNSGPTRTHFTPRPID
jgi:hypothetical protein